jgi:hypothetical protein
MIGSISPPRIPLSGLSENYSLRNGVSTAHISINARMQPVLRTMQTQRAPVGKHFVLSSLKGDIADPKDKPL